MAPLTDAHPEEAHDRARSRRRPSHLGRGRLLAPPRFRARRSSDPRATRPTYHSRARASCTRASCSARTRTPRSTGSTRPRRPAVPGRGRRPHRRRPPDQGLRGHADVPAPRERARRCSRASRWRWSSLRARRRPRTAWTRWSWTTRRSSPRSTPTQAMAVDAALARPHKHNPGEDAGQMVSPHAAVGHADEGEATASPHAAVGGGADRPKITEELSSNVVGKHWHKRGDVDAALAGSAVRASGTFTTDWVYQAYLEPHGATAWLEGSGELVVAGGMQGIFYTRSQLAKIFGLQISKVRAVGTPLGGAFGSKIMVVEPLAAAAALKLRRPVRLALTRREDMTMTNPAAGHPDRARDRGRRRRPVHRASRSRMVFDSGAFSEWTVESIGADPHRRAVSLAGVGRQGVRRRDEPRRHGLVSRTGRAAGVVRAREPARRHRRAAQHRPRSRSAVATPWCRATSWSTASRGSASAPRRSSNAISEHPLWKGRNEPAGGRGRRPVHRRVARRQGAGRGDVPPRGRRHRHDHHRRRRHERRRRRGSPRSPPRRSASTRSRVNIVASDTSSAPRSPMSGGSVVTYSARARAIQRSVEDLKTRLLQVRQRGAGDRSGRPGARATAASSRRAPRRGA